VNLLKGGLIFTRAITTVSPTYAQEIQTEKYGCGLEGVLSSRRDRLQGILNGLDYESWDPSIDVYLAKKYSAESLENKEFNKRHIQKALNLPQKRDIPLLGFVGRLSHQKGLDLLIECFEKLMKMELQIVFIGTGEEKYHQFLKEMAKTYPDKAAAVLGYNEPLAHILYAGSDFFLMPSVYEPCGLGQMIALRYGSIPVVFHTGGLADTVVPYDAGKDEGNGFVFKEYSAKSFMEAVKNAFGIFSAREKLARLRKRAMQQRVSWSDSAKKYLEVYLKSRN